MDLVETTQQPPDRLVAALHRSWTGTLELGGNGRVRHCQHGSLGDYFLTEQWLLVRWDDWPNDLFSFDGDKFIDQALNGLSLFLDATRRQSTRIAGQNIPVHALVVPAPASSQLVELRPGTSDISVYQAIFLEREYGLPIAVEPIQTIVDLGANIGLSALFFSNRFPGARIVAVEPEADNFTMLSRNVKHCPNITPVRAAIWNSDTTVSIALEGTAGEPVESWGFQTREAQASVTDGWVEALSLVTLMRRFSLRNIDLLKIDIEGAEMELFGAGTESWLPYVRMIVIETHERFRAGIDSLVTLKLASEFIEQPHSGENRVFSRRPSAPLRGLAD